MNVFVILGIIISLLSFITGLTVFIKNPKSKINQLFFGFTLTASVWTLLYSLIDLSNTNDTASTINSISHFTAALMLFIIYKFTKEISPNVHPSLIDKVFTLISVVIIILSASSFIAGTVQIIDNQQNFAYGELYIIYVTYIAVSLILVINNLKIFKNDNSQLIQQKTTIRNGLIVSISAGLILGAIIPVVLGDETLIDDFAPLALLYFIFISGYTIVRHRLFDIKSIIVRSVAYIFSSLFIAVVYVLSAIYLKRIFLPETKLELSQLIANILLTIILVLTFPYIKRHFDRVSNKYFFRDAYDPQELIDRLNQTLVTNVNLDELLTKSALIMQEEMKASFCTFYIRQTSYFDNRIIGAHRKLPEFDDIDEIQKYAAKIHTKVFSSDVHTDNDIDKKLAQVLKKNEVEVMARLTNTLDFEVKGIGYIFMGPKKSGSPYGTNDLKVLEIIANELVIAIENVLRFEEIEQFNVTLQKKIDDATKELKQTNEKLRALDEAKDEFVSMASHQLRTPLTSIKGYLSMVLEGDAGKITETQKTMLGQAFFSSQRMVYLISDLLNVSRLKTGKFVIESKPVYLPDVVESEINQLQDGATAKNLTLTFTKPKEFATMNLDEMKLRQVIMNFTDNAIYYTPAGGKINIELKETPNAVEFTVKDSGIGVPKDQQHKLYTKFYRADNARKARPDGTGLGLFMAKKVVIAQGGSMIFESKENKGSTFGFSFPKDRLESKTEPQVEKHTETGSKSK